MVCMCVWCHGGIWFTSPARADLHPSHTAALTVRVMRARVRFYSKHFLFPGTELHKDIELYLNKKVKLEDEFLTRQLSTSIQMPEGARVVDAKIAELQQASQETASQQEEVRQEEVRRASFSVRSPAGEFVERTYFLAFMKDVVEKNRWKPFRTEWRIFDSELQIAGTIDFVVTRDKLLENIEDGGYKTCRSEQRVCP